MTDHIATTRLIGYVAVPRLTGHVAASRLSHAAAPRLIEWRRLATSSCPQKFGLGLILTSHKCKLARLSGWRSGYRLRESGKC